MSATKDERQYMSDVASLGCVVCRNEGYGESPAEIHHIRAGSGLGQRATNYDVIPLCAPHHRTGGPGVAFHAGQKQFEVAFNTTEQELLEQTVEDVRVLRSSIVGR